VLCGASFKQLFVEANHSVTGPDTLRDENFVTVILVVEPICLISINAASHKRGKLPINAPWTASAKSAS